MIALFGLLLLFSAGFLWKALPSFKLWSISFGLLILLSSAIYVRMGDYMGVQHFLADRVFQKNILKAYANPESILDQMEVAVVQNPNDPKAWFLLGRLQIAFHDTDEAVESFGNANRLKPNDPDIMMNTATAIFQANGNRLNAQSKALLEKVMALDPNNPEPLNLLALNAFYSKNYSVAISYWQTILSHYPLDAGTEAALQKTIEETQRLMG